MSFTLFEGFYLLSTGLDPNLTPIPAEASLIAQLVPPLGISLDMQATGPLSSMCRHSRGLRKAEGPGSPSTLGWASTGGRGGSRPQNP